MPKSDVCYPSYVFELSQGGRRRTHEQLPEIWPWETGEGEGQPSPGIGKIIGFWDRTPASTRSEAKDLGG